MTKTLLNFILIIIVGFTVGFPSRNIKVQSGIENAAENKNTLVADDGKAEAPPTNPLSGLQQWLSGSSGGGNMVLGTYQALVMPMPQGQDITSGITNVAQGIQGLFQG